MYIRCVTIAFSTLSNAFFLRLNISVYPMHFFLIFRPVCASSHFISVLMSTQYFLSCLQCLSNQNFFWYLILLCLFLFCCIYLDVYSMHFRSFFNLNIIFYLMIHNVITHNVYLMQLSIQHTLMYLSIRCYL